MGKFLVAAILIFAGSALPAIAQQEPNDSSGDVRYITDDLFTFMHSGPGRNYRILGSVQAGTRITVLQVNQEQGFVEMIDDQQRTGWVQLEYVTNQQSMREQVPGLLSQVSELQQTVANQKTNNDLLSQQVLDLTSRTTQLNDEVEKAKRLSSQLQRELDMLDQSAQMEWFTRGGIIAVIGIILGVIIAYLPKKRRRNDQWM